MRFVITIQEIISPKVIKEIQNKEPFFQANFKDEEDLKALLDLSNKNFLKTNVNSWQKVLPLYPISPIN